MRNKVAFLLQDNQYVVQAICTGLIMGMMLSVLFTPRIFGYDTWWHLKTGEWIISHHAVPKSDPFSWTARGTEWLAHEWLFEVIIYAAANKLGFYGLVIVVMACLELMIYFIWRTLGTLDIQPDIRFAILLATVFGTTSVWVARPHMLGLACLSYFIYVTVAKNSRLVWTFPLVMLVWANAHGSAMLGVAIVLCETLFKFLPGFSAGRVVHKHGCRNERVVWAAGSVLTVLAFLVTPHGFDLWCYIVKACSEPYLKTIQEWKPVDFSTSFNKLRFGLMFAGLGMSFAFGKGKCRPQSLLYFIMFLMIALDTRRHVPILFMFWSVLIAELSGSKARRCLTSKVEAVGVLTCVVVFISSFVIGMSSADMEKNALDSGRFPVKAVNYIESQGLEKILNKYGWGGYLIWRGIPVFVDGRSDMYHCGGNVYKDYREMRKKPENTEKILKKYRPQTVLWSAKDFWMAYFLKNSGWKEVYRDDVAVVFSRGGN